MDRQPADGAADLAAWIEVLVLTAPKRKERDEQNLGHSEKEITERVYRRLGEVVKPTK